VQFVLANLATEYLRLVLLNLLSILAAPISHTTSEQYFAKAIDYSMAEAFRWFPCSPSLLGPGYP
jgi:hypothetical protein